MIRRLHPLDLFPLLFLDGRGNQAQPRSHLGRPCGRLEPFRQWLMRPSRPMLVAERWGRLEGLVSVRPRSPQIWEVEHLWVSPDEDETGHQLLEGLGFCSADLKVDRVFLRLPVTSSFLDAASQAGFHSYLTEFLYYIPGRSQDGPGPASFRPRTPQDDFRLFQLFGVSVPAPVRQAEGLTLEEWQANWELPGCRELVWDKGDHIEAWLRLRTRGGRAGFFDLLLRPGAQDALEPILEGCLNLLRGRSPILCLVSEHQESLRRALVERGFREEARLATLVRPTVARIKQPLFIPMRA